MKQHSLRLTLALLTFFTSLSFGHGWTDFPKARQTICADDGGYWSTNGEAMPNSACRAALQESGTYPFVQKNEFAANVIDYTNQAAIEAAVPDGTLCSGGSPAKSGMDIPHLDWQKTKMASGEHTLRFRATAPHNPSFWRIYLSKPGFHSATDRLAWSDLELIQTYGNISVTNGYYEMQITLPEGREGDAILFVHWQREDPAGEGFYNCSDIRFSDSTDGGSTPDPDPAPELVSLGYFVTAAHDIADIDDTVKFRLFNASGQEVLEESLTIDSTNQELSIWARDLALKINDRHADQAFIGFWHDAMNHLMLDQTNILNNKVWAEAANFSFSTSVIKVDDGGSDTGGDDGNGDDGNGDGGSDNGDDQNNSVTWDANTVYTAGDTVIYAGIQYTAGWWTKGNQPDLGGVWKADQAADAVRDWHVDAVYVAEDKVNHKGQLWKAKWWTQGDEPGQADVWQSE
ncbi:MAG: lytic polysaccharide monooxygenase [Cellvibrionales bacterium]|nr:lytic polysaccharide monooxygenase [Cellvibrionales bacterium]